MQKITVIPNWECLDCFMDEIKTLSKKADDLLLTCSNDCNIEALVSTKPAVKKGDHDDTKSASSCQ